MSSRPYVESAAIVTGVSAVVLSMVLRSHRADVARLLEQMPAAAAAQVEATLAAVEQCADASRRAIDARARLPLTEAAVDGGAEAAARWGSTSEAAAELGVSERRVRQLAEAKRLPGATKVAGRWVVPLQEGNDGE